MRNPPEARSISSPAAVMTLLFAGLAVVFLAALHVLSPEFSPAWRMISEYANGRYPGVLSLMFACYGLSFLALAFTIRSQVTTGRARAGLVLLVVAGIGASSAAFFDLNQVALHELAGALGIICLPLAAMLITRSLVAKEPWSGARTPLLWMANLTWISVVLWVASFVVMVVTFVHVLGGIPTTVPKEVPAGAIAIVGWTNRLLVLSAWAWAAGVAWVALREVAQSSPGAGHGHRQLT